MGGQRNHYNYSNWRFVDDTGAFVLQGPHTTSYLYFLLVNEAGMMLARVDVSLARLTV